GGDGLGGPLELSLGPGREPGAVVQGRRQAALFAGRRAGGAVSPGAGELRQGDVLGNVDEHRSGPAGGGDGERFVDDAGQVPGVLDQVVVLGDGPGDADDVRLLEGVGPD